MYFYIFVKTVTVITVECGSIISEKKLSSSASSQWSYYYLQKCTTPGQNQPTKARRNVLAMSITFVYSCIRTGIITGLSPLLSAVLQPSLHSGACCKRTE
ncbi:hypothetical protein AMECASPLE_015130 [Ameca splendens]|uniref:Uncharacterized protein n=1 Tax=Ameca splendens TaxID=208324 RepID=A0ABV0ZAL7_9TELE